MLLVLAPLASLSLAGQEHGRTIPLPDMDATVRTHSLLLFENRPIHLTRIAVHLTFELDRNP